MLDTLPTGRGWASGCVATQAAKVSISTRSQYVPGVATRMHKEDAIDPFRADPAPRGTPRRIVPGAPRFAALQQRTRLGAIMGLLDAGALTLLKALQRKGEKLANKGGGTRVCEEPRG